MVGVHENSCFGMVTFEMLVSSLPETNFVVPEHRPEIASKGNESSTPTIGNVQGYSGVMIHDA